MCWRLASSCGRSSALHGVAQSEPHKLEISEGVAELLTHVEWVVPVETLTELRASIPVKVLSELPLHFAVASDINRRCLHEETVCFDKALEHRNIITKKKAPVASRGS